MIRNFLIPFVTFFIAPFLFAESANIEIGSNDMMQFDKKAFEVVEGQQVTLTLSHNGKLPKMAMGHNIVILTPGANVQAFAMKSAAMGANDYLPNDEESKKQIIAATRMLGGGEKDTIAFTAPAAGEYPFICSFPGHFAMMQGVMSVKPKP